MSERRTFGDLRKYKGGKDLERWEFDQRKKIAVKPAAAAPQPEQMRILGTEALSPRKKVR